MPRTLPREVKVHLEKARESAILAVDVYNKPSTSFRSGGYIVLMCIAWTALFHAIFYKRGQKPFFRNPNQPRLYAKVDGDYKAWELKECINQYYGSSDSPIRRNLLFFIGLRNKIEHRSMPSLDHRIFGECQALILNFEDLLFLEFGSRHALNESLTLALQFSHLRDPMQARATQKLHLPLAKDIENYIASFRSSLTPEQLHDLQYSFKVFLVPKTVNQLGQADLAIEFIKYDPDDPDQANGLARLVLVRPTVTQVINPGRLRPLGICQSVEPIVQTVAGQECKFNASYHHVRACFFYQIRPRKGVGDPRKTDVKYCQYDEPHKDYVYTEAWKQFLIEEMKKPGQYEKVMRSR